MGPGPGGHAQARDQRGNYYVWRKRYGQMAIAGIRWLRQLEEENSRLKQLVADLTLDKVILQEVLAKTP